MKMKPPVFRKRITLRRDYAADEPIESIGVATLIGDDGTPFVSMRVRSPELGRGRAAGLMLRMSPALAGFLRDALDDALAACGASVEGAADAVAAPVPPSPVDGVYAPGEPHRRGRWVAPIPAELREPVVSKGTKRAPKRKKAR